jgi:hypothetical protein
VALESMRMEALPPSLVEDIGKSASDYVVGLVKIRGTPTDIDAAVGGTGTCIRVGQTRAILTAAHVVEHFAADEVVGINLASRFEPVLPATIEGTLRRGVG